MTSFSIVAGLVFCLGSHAQTTTYTYDASGNCTGRFSQTQNSKEGSSEKSFFEDFKESNNLEFDSNTNKTELLIEENSITVYPNPTNTGQFQVELKGYDDLLSKGMMTIYSSQGQAVFKISSLQTINNVNLNNQPIGTYVIHITIGGKLETHKVVVER